MITYILSPNVVFYIASSGHTSYSYKLWHITLFLILQILKYSEFKEYSVLQSDVIFSPFLEKLSFWNIDT